MKSWATFIPKVLLCLGTVTLVVFLFTASAHASHYRHTNIHWKPAPDSGLYAAEFVIISEFRRNEGHLGPGPFSGGDGFPITGDLINVASGAATISFGNSTSTPLTLHKVIDYNVAENWVLTEVVQVGSGAPNIFHTYPAPLDGTKPWLAEISGCCRLNEAVNYNIPYHVQSLVRFDISNSSPISTLIPKVPVTANNVSAYFYVPASDPDGDQLRWRLASQAESGIDNPIGPDRWLGN